LQKAHAELIASDMEEDKLTDEQKEDLKRIRQRKKQVRLWLLFMSHTDFRLERVVWLEYTGTQPR
jgi:hypothetical protein